MVRRLMLGERVWLSLQVLLATIQAGIRAFARRIAKQLESLFVLLLLWIYIPSVLLIFLLCGFEFRFPRVTSGLIALLLLPVCAGLLFLVFAVGVWLWLLLERMYFSYRRWRIRRWAKARTPR